VASMACLDTLAIPHLKLVSVTLFSPNYSSYSTSYPSEFIFGVGIATVHQLPIQRCSKSPRSSRVFHRNAVFRRAPRTSQYLYSHIIHLVRLSGTTAEAGVAYDSDTFSR
jgi:hypothetical protein